MADVPILSEPSPLVRKGSEPLFPVNPSYPHRVHVHKRKQLRALLDDWERRIAEVGATLDDSASEERRRLYIQMLGARDQLTYVVERIPLEAGNIYKEDEELFAHALRALERLFREWERSR